MYTKYCRNLNVYEYLSSWFGYVWHSWCFDFASVVAGVLFCMQALYLASFYFHNSKEPRKTVVTKLARKQSILQYLERANRFPGVHKRFTSCIIMERNYVAHNYYGSAHDM